MSIRGSEKCLDPGIRKGSSSECHFQPVFRACGTHRRSKAESARKNHIGQYTIVFPTVIKRNPGIFNWNFRMILRLTDLQPTRLFDDSSRTHCFLGLDLIEQRKTGSDPLTCFQSDLRNSKNRSLTGLFSARTRETIRCFLFASCQ
jgi:hypothetical protein